MILDQSPFQAAAEILCNLKFTKTSELAEKISLAAETFANASGYYILPCPKWEAKAKAYKNIESRNYITLFTETVASDIRAYELYKDGADQWLKAIHKEWIAEQARKRMLVSFDSAYEKWQERKNMRKEEILKKRTAAVKHYNRTFRENPNMGYGFFFADQLEQICR
jgi:hypothetical protein